MRFDCILVNITEQCSVGCRHCGYVGSERDREMTLSEMESWVNQAASFGIPKIIFTGGEPFERYEVLARGVRRAQMCGAMTAVFTSSIWATSLDKARQALHGLKGISHLYLSTDVYHQKRIPISYVYNAIDAAIELDLPRVSLVITYANDADRAAVEEQYSQYGDRIEVMTQLLNPNKSSRRTMKGHTPMFGISPEQYSAKCWLGTPLINPDGTIFACHIGKAAAHGDIKKSPYFLGNLREAPFNDIMSRARLSPHYQYLRTHGPRGVVEMTQHSPTVMQALTRTQFTSGCDMCISVMLVPKALEVLTTYAEASKEEIDMRLALLLSEEPAFGVRTEI